MLPCPTAIGGMRVSQPKSAAKLQQRKKKVICANEKRLDYDKFPICVFRVNRALGYFAP
jgi:hypothetical protein